MQAKLCNKATRDRLVIALEPECAALYVRKYESTGNASKSSTYAVVDCGGGIIDIAYHSLDKRANDTDVVEELTPPTGGPHGGTVVNRGFEKLLEMIFGKPLNNCRQSETPFIDRLKKECTTVWMDLMNDFEACKAMIQDDFTDEICFMLGFRFSRACYEISGDGCANLVKHCGVRGVTLSDSNELFIEASVLAQLFTKPIEDTQACLSKGLMTIPKVEALYMVGSFSKCDRLYNSIQDRVPGEKKVNKDYVYRPEECGLAVVRGAVLYGFKPTLVQERISAYSYGLGTTSRCDETNCKHPSGRVREVKSTGMFYHKYIYDEFLHRGEKIQNTTTLIKRTYYPLEPDQTSVGIPVYCAPTSVEYINDEGCQELATINVPMPDTTGGVNRAVLVEITFDGPEIYIVCTDETSGSKMDESVAFYYET